MSASGPLSARYPGAHPEPLRTGVLPAPTLVHPGCWWPPLTVYRYHDLWFAAGAWDRRVTFAALEGAAGSGGCTLLDDTRTGGAGIMVNGAVLATGEQARQYASAALALRDRWVERGAPAIGDWRGTLKLAGDPGQPIWTPQDWWLRQAG
jgi:protein-L-isoaspartate(D-aspartate) O-methyltransferase